MQSIALWEGLSDAERHTDLSMSDEQAAELERRWADHVADPRTAIPWAEVRRRLSSSK